VKNGFDATRPQDVADEADVAVGTFYAHFADKRGAFLAFTEQAAQELMDCMRASAGDAVDFELRLRRSLLALLAYSDANPGVLRAAFADAAVIAAGLPRSESLRERFAQSLAQGLRDGIAAGTLHDDIDPELTAQGIVGFVHQAVAHGLERGTPREDLVENVTRFIGRALMRATRPCNTPLPETPLPETRKDEQ